VSVDAARAIAPIFDAGRLKLARQARGLLKTQLAQKVQVTPAAIGQFESGTVKPSASTLAQLAFALGFPIEFFAHTGESAQVPTISDTFFRSLRSARQTERQQAVAHATLVWEVVRKLEEKVRLPDLDLPTDLHVTETTPLDAIEGVAGDLRKRWDVKQGPIPHVIRMLELHGIVVTRYWSGSERLDAFSCPFPERPIIVLGDDKGQFDRSRFDGVHELGHLVMHPDPQPGDRTLENQAQRFAAAFLMPRDEIIDELPRRRVNWIEVVTLKRTWGVSIQALLYRARTLGTLDANAYENAMKTMSRRGWRRIEPGYLGRPERPQMLSKAIEALTIAGFTMKEVVELTRLSETMLEVILGVEREEIPEIGTQLAGEAPDSEPSA
jgi:Zn-dependent peptidase ImmA (M78 family)/transcriptional regulator with XRE-family HTH domain